METQEENLVELLMANCHYKLLGLDKKACEANAFAIADILCERDLLSTFSNFNLYKTINSFRIADIRIRYELFYRLEPYVIKAAASHSWSTN